MATVISKQPTLSASLVAPSSATDEERRPDPREKSPRGLEVGALNGVRPSATKKVTVIDHPVAQHALTALRNKNTVSEEFRAYSNQLLLLLSIEATRSMPMREEPVDAHSSVHEGKALAKPVVLLAVTRDGLGLAHDLARSIAGVQVGSISLNTVSDSKRLEPRIHLFNSPVLNDVRTILFDPIVATGLSATLALNLVRRSGATDVALLSFLVSSQGLERLQAGFPELSVWTAAIDTNWDAKRGPLPGIWNFSERMYG